MLSVFWMNPQSFNVLFSHENFFAHVVYRSIFSIFSREKSESQRRNFSSRAKWDRKMCAWRYSKCCSLRVCVGVQYVASSAREIKWNPRINTNLQTITTHDCGGEWDRKSTTTTTKRAHNLWGWNVCRLCCATKVISFSNNFTSRWMRLAFIMDKLAIIGRCLDSDCWWRERFLSEIGPNAHHHVCLCM